MANENNGLFYQPMDAKQAILNFVTAFRCVPLKTLRKYMPDTVRDSEFSGCIYELYHGKKLVMDDRLVAMKDPEAELCTYETKNNNMTATDRRLNRLMKAQAAVIAEFGAERVSFYQTNPHIKTQTVFLLDDTFLCDITTLNANFSAYDLAEIYQSWQRPYQIISGKFIPVAQNGSGNSNGLLVQDGNFTDNGIDDVIHFALVSARITDNGWVEYQQKLVDAGFSWVVTYDPDTLEISIVKLDLTPTHNTTIQTRAFIPTLKKLMDCFYLLPEGDYDALNGYLDALYANYGE